MYFSENYLAHFTPDFLFISGAPHKQHHVQGVGEMYLFQFPLVLLGLWFMYKKKTNYRHIVLAWILLGIIPVSVTNDSIPHALRTLIVAPAYQIISGYGVYQLFIYLKKRSEKIKMSAYILAIAIVLISFSLYIYNYYFIYPVKYSKDWQYGNKQVVEYINSNQNKYDEVVYSRTYGEPQIFTLFYLNYDPYLFQNDPTLQRFETHDWVRVLRFRKYYFPDLGDLGTRYQDIVAKDKNKKILFIGKINDFPLQNHILKQINFLNGEPDFVITDNQ